MDGWIIFRSVCWCFFPHHFCFGLFARIQHQMCFPKYHSRHTSGFRNKEKQKRIWLNELLLKCRENIKLYIPTDIHTKPSRCRDGCLNSSWTVELRTTEMHKLYSKFYLLFICWYIWTRQLRHCRRTSNPPWSHVNVKGQASALQANTPTDRNNHLIFTSRPDMNLVSNKPSVSGYNSAFFHKHSSIISVPDSNKYRNKALWLSCNHSFRRTTLKVDSTSQDDLIPPKKLLSDPWFCTKAFWLQYSLSCSSCDIFPEWDCAARSILKGAICGERSTRCQAQQMDLVFTHLWMRKVCSWTDLDWKWEAEMLARITLLFHLIERHGERRTEEIFFV